MKAPFSDLARIMEKKYGGYSLTMAASENISLQEAHDRLIMKGVDPWTAQKLDPDYVKNYMRKKKMEKIISKKS